MSNASNQNQSTKSNLPVNEKILTQMLEAQMLKAKNDTKELEIKSKEIDYQAEYANNSLKLQAELLKSKPSENRKTMTTLAFIVMGFVFIFVILVTICLYFNKEVFLLTLLKGFGYIITTLAGYWFGKKSNETKKSEIEEQEEN